MLKEKVHIGCEKGTQISILANKIVTQWWPNIVIKEIKQTVHYIYFLFSHYVHIMLLVWSKNWNYPNYEIMPKLMCPKLVYWCQKQPVSTPAYIYVHWTMKKHTENYKATHIVLNWFQINSMVATPVKFQMFLGSSINNNHITFIVENKHLAGIINKVKLLGITICHKLTFKKHMNHLCNATSNHKSFDKNKKIFISIANKTSFWGLYNVGFQTLSINIGVLW